MKIIFMGTPKFSLPALKALKESNYGVSLVITNPDAPKGRSLRPIFSPVKEYAVSQGMGLLQPESLRDEDFKSSIISLNPDLIVVVAFGKILPDWLLAAPHLGCINLHASLLPKFRGAAPIQRAILEGEKVTGLTTMFMDSGLDTGKILLQEEIKIGDFETAGELSEKLASLGGPLLLKTIKGIESGKLIPLPQDESRASYAAKISKGEARIDWLNSAIEIQRLVCALNPSPGAFTFHKGSRLKIWRAQAVEESSAINPGQCFFSSADSAPLISCALGSLKPTQVQPEGKSRMSFDDFIRGRAISESEIFS